MLLLCDQHSVATLSPTMAERSSDRKDQPVLPQTRRRPSSTRKAERTKKEEFRPQARSASGPTRTLTDDLLAKEEQYKLLNAERDAKIADLVRQADELMREQHEVLSKPSSNILLTETEDGEDCRFKSRQRTGPTPRVKVVTKTRATSTLQNTGAGKPGRDPHCRAGASEVSPVDGDAAVEDPAHDFLAKTIRSMEERMSDAVTHEHVVDEDVGSGEHVGSGIADAQMRVLKAKLRIMQEELDQLSCEYYKKDDENAKLSAKMKELEEDRARLQKTTSIQQTQIEKHRALAEEAAKRCDGLQLQVSGLHKETEHLNRSQKQAAAVHSTVEVRLNRALEEVERLKTQLNKMKQMNKDKTSKELQSREHLLAENKMLQKQKAELIVGFKKQLKLIDILKRQKMHVEAAKLLSFTEDEFMKALDWGKA